MPRLLRPSEQLSAAMQQVRTELLGPSAGSGHNGPPLNLGTLQATMQSNQAQMEQQMRGAAAENLSTMQTALTNGLSGKLNLTGGKMTGPLEVQTPAAAANPIQYSSLPFSMTVNQPLPLIALGGLYSFTVTVPNAVVGQVVVLNLPPSLLTGGVSYGAAVTAANTVTITLKAGVSIAAGAQTFYLRVLR